MKANNMNIHFPPRRRLKEPISLRRRLTPVQKIMRAARTGKGVTLTDEEVEILADLTPIQSLAEHDTDDERLREEITGRSYREG